MPSEPALPEPLPLGDAQVWLWFPDEAPPAGTCALEAVLDEADRRRLRALAKGAPTEEFCRGRWLLRQVLSRYAPVVPAAWRFTAPETGRPEVVAPDSARWLRFSLSHTRGLIGCAVARDRAVGLDLEDSGREVRAMRIAARFFAPAEAADLRDLPEGERTARFFDLWTAKEARLKAEGQTLAETLARPPEADGAVQWHRLRLPPPHVGCLAATGGPCTVRLRVWPTG